MLCGWRTLSWVLVSSPNNNDNKNEGRVQLGKPVLFHGGGEGGLFISYGVFSACTHDNTTVIKYNYTTTLARG